jgi:mono/diheme cytochrome c family protein
MDMAFVLLIMAALAGPSYFHPATLGPIANPADTHFLPRPEWYYLPMFEWLKFWEGPYVVVGVMALPGLLAMVFFLMPFLDRKLERSPWRRPIPVLAVAFVFLGMVLLGIKSRMDDRNNPDIAAQLDFQEQQERAYSAAPFEPYLESQDGIGTVVASAAVSDQLLSVGKGIFTTRGCVACHGSSGMGTAAAPSLVGVTRKFAERDLIALLHNPSPKMRAGRMPVVDAPPAEMSALVAYLGVLGTSAANVTPIYNAPPTPSAAGIKLNASLTGDANRSTGGVRQAVLVPFSASAASGQQLFQERACFACHGQAGAGGRAPALAPLVAELSDAQILQLLRDPDSKMRAGGMPPVEASPEQFAALITYLRTLPQPEPGKRVAPEHGLPDEASRPGSHATVPVLVAANTSPVLPKDNAIKAMIADSGGKPAIPVAQAPNPGRQLYVGRGCIACHGPKAEGTRIAPSLIGISERFPGEKLPYLLHHPTSKMRDGGMPAVTVSDEQLAELVTYLSSLKPALVERTDIQPQSDPHNASAQSDRGPVAVIQAVPAHEPVEVPLSPLVLRGKRTFQRSACETCHGEGGVSGTIAAPGLAGTASLLPEPNIEALLRHHTARMNQGGMPPTNFNAQDMKAIVAYIRSMTSDPERKFVASEAGNKRN